jgi:hypothetical protein
MTRDPLPPRRPNVSIDIDWNGHPITLTVGFDPDTGAAREVFADTAKGGQMAATVADGCVWASILLQMGCDVAALGKSLARVPGPGWAGGADMAASPLGAIADALAGIAAQVDGGAA